MENIFFHEQDLPTGIDFGSSVAVDTETMGLNLNRDRLCLVQLSSGDGTAHLVRFKNDYDAPNLKKLLENKSVLKIFHFARFDIAALYKYLGAEVSPVYCTKIVSKLVRTNTDAHSLKTLCAELLGIELEKESQCSDWGADTLTDTQLKYAAGDVLYLHKIKKELDKRLAREGREELAAECFNFLPTRAKLDVLGFNGDIFSHASV
jgi:ribonuclease D